MSTLRMTLCALAVASMTIATSATLYAQDEAKPKADAPAKDAAEAKAEEKPDIGPFDSVIHNASYALGADIGQNLATNFQQGDVKPDVDKFLQGLSDSLRGNELKLTEAQRMAAMNALEQIIIAKQQEADEARKVAAMKFLEGNKAAEGVTVTESGLQYKVIKEGDGKVPTKDDVVTVHYRGTLIDGTEFDSSYKRNRPATFPVGGVIPGWVEALQMMKTGAKYRLFIPPDLGYGATPPPRSPIPANAVLIFDVELLDIVKQDEQPAPPGAPQQ